MSEKEKPKVKLVGQNGNVFNLLGICTRALKRADQDEEAKQLQKRVTSSGSYAEALGIMLEYVDEVGDYEEEYDDDDDDD